MKNLSLEQKNTVVYIFSQLIVKAIPFLLIPFITKILSPEEYGNIALFLLAIQTCVIFFINASNTYYRANFVHNLTDKDELFNKCFFNYFVNSIFFSILFVVFSSLYVNLQGLSYSIVNLILIVIISFFEAGLLLIISYYQVERSALTIASINICAAAFNMGVCLILLYGGFREDARYYGLLIAYGGVFTFVFFKYKFYEKVSFKKCNIDFEQFTFGYKVLPHALSWWVRFGLDRLIVVNFFSLAMLGKYSLLVQMASIYTVLINSINQAYTPKIMLMMKSGDVTSVRKLFFKIDVLLSIFFVVSCVVLMSVFDYFVGTEYHEIKGLIPIASFAAFIQVYIIFRSNIFYYYGCSGMLSVITSVTSILNIFLSIVLIKLGGGVHVIFYSSIASTIIATLWMFLEIKNKWVKV